MVANTMSGFVEAGIFPREWSFALQGELQAFSAAAGEAVHKAALRALDVVSADGKERLRSLVVRAGLAKKGAGSGKGTGRSLASAVRSIVFPNNADPRGPAALIYVQPSAVHIYKAFEEGAEIGGKGGKYLTIPVPGSPAARENFGDKPRGMSVLDKLKSRGLEIVVKPPMNGEAGIIFARSVRLRQDKYGRSKVSRAARTKSGAMAKGATEIPLFFIVPRASIKARIDMRGEFRRIADRFMREFAQEFQRQLEMISAGQRYAEAA